jgi:hypothetical protein
MSSLSCNGSLFIALARHTWHGIALLARPGSRQGMGANGALVELLAAVSAATKQKRREHDPARGILSKQAVTIFGAGATIVVSCGPFTPAPSMTARRQRSGDHLERNAYWLAKLDYGRGVGEASECDADHRLTPA